MERLSKVTKMATENDERLLLEIWNPVSLSGYEGDWIAFRDGRILMSSETFEGVSDEFRGEIQEGAAPLFAFVSFMASA